jgi:hypothetical protein
MLLQSWLSLEEKFSEECMGELKQMKFGESEAIKN